MRIVFVSNFLNHHQQMLCEELKKRCEEFRFIATENVEGAGYQRTVSCEYALNWFSPEDKAEAEQIIASYDVAIFGSCPHALIAGRMKENRLSFIFSERFFKDSMLMRFYPKRRRNIKQRVADYSDKRMYALCASAYLPYELSLFGFPAEKCFKWGYFPEARYYSDIDALLRSKSRGSILWAGRFVDFKAPEKAIWLAERVRDMGIEFELNMIGDGPLRGRIEKMILKKGLSDRVHLLGSKTPEDVRAYMEASSLFLFTSTKGEGWGAVLNEAMNSCCAVLVSHAPGSSPFLVEDGVNGVLYKNDSLKDMTVKAARLLADPDLCAEYGKKACESIMDKWNPSSAAERFVRLAQALISEEPTDSLYSDGPISNVKIIKNNWYKGE